MELPRVVPTDEWSTSRAAVAPREDFARVTDPYRRELLAHCYRMLGSVTDAEDAVQDTYLGAWRSYHTFEGRSSLRTWLYRIATRACLKALERHNRRPMPSGLHGSTGDPEAPIGRELPEIHWLEPMPDRLYVANPPDPAAVAEARQTMRLALVAALQHLPPRQRAVLILRDVLDWRAAEVADLLGTTSTGINSTLRRARAQLAQVRPVAEELAEPSEPELRGLLDRYAAAFENSDVAALTRLLTDDVSWEMPPYAAWYTGRETVVRFLAGRLPRRGAMRLVPVGANGQPAFALYLREADGVHRAHAVHVLTVVDRSVGRVVSFMDPALFAAFGLPAVLDP